MFFSHLYRSGIENGEFTHINPLGGTLDIQTFGNLSQQILPCLKQSTPWAELSTLVGTGRGDQSLLTSW